MTLPPVAVFNKAVFQGVFARAVTLTIGSSERWCVVGPGKSKFLKLLAGGTIALPPLALTFPFLRQQLTPLQSFRLLDFKGLLPTAHIAARYEFFKDEFDLTTEKFVRGENIITHRDVDPARLADVMERLQLGGLEQRWALGLSNGQMRRARIAKALMDDPKLLVMDDPFLGLDPAATTVVSAVLQQLPPEPQVVLGLRYSDAVPEWITHIAVVEEDGVVAAGARLEVEPVMQQKQREVEEANRQEVERFKKRVGSVDTVAVESATPHIELRGVSVAYRGQPVLTDLAWTVKRGEKWHIRGRNGSGKSTLLALLTADHPQLWNTKIVFNGVPRRTGKVLYFDINKEIGFLLPELHQIFPRRLTLEQAVATGFQVGNFLVPKLTPEQQLAVDTLIDAFRLDDKRSVEFGDLSISDQKVVLFMRAVVARPQLVVLDEALLVMDPVRVEECRAWLDANAGPMTVLAIAHLPHELPTCSHYLQLAGPGDYAIGAV